MEKGQLLLAIQKEKRKTLIDRFILLVVKVRDINTIIVRQLYHSEDCYEPDLIIQKRHFKCSNNNNEHYVGRKNKKGLWSFGDNQNEADSNRIVYSVKPLKLTAKQSAKITANEI